MSHSLRSLLIVAVLAAVPSAQADVSVPALFTDHMVLQRDLADPIWGKADAGEAVTVTIAGQKHTATAGADGTWKVTLEPMKAGGPHELVIQGKNKLTIGDVLVGEVWLCSGQSNMEWSVGQTFNADLELLTANNSQIRFITAPHNGVQEPQWTFKGQWDVCTPETAASFSAVGYFFGRQLQQTLGVPVGLIDVSWGGSACEAWVNRDLLTKDGRFSELIANWETIEKGYNKEKADADFAAAQEKYKVAVEEAKKAGKPIPRGPQHAGGRLTGNSRPGNIYNGSLKPMLGYGIKGNIWYQGESNASRAYQYRDLFPLMIDSWRKEWGQGDFSFYWVQLADFLAEKAEPGESNWAELREAQTMTMKKLPNTGEAVIIDIGEANDIHPRNKLDVGLRLARWALNKDYGYDKIPCQSPTFKEADFVDQRVIVSFDNVGGSLKAHDYSDLRGFAVAGDDKVWHWATAQISGPNKVTVSSKDVKKPVAVRYGWADNPICNLRSSNGLPATPFRTDDWPGLTAGVNK
jgi:sialate O-acetylesterase